jgi:hypothetical protein
MSDRKTTDVQISYDLVADEYVRRIFEELEHKPLDRELLDRFAAHVQGIRGGRDCGARAIRGRGAPESAGLHLRREAARNELVRAAGEP